MLKSLYYLPFISAFLIYSARDKGFHTDLSTWKVMLAILFLIIPAAYWLYERFKSKRR